MKFCPDCGKKLLKEDLKFCPECGATLKTAPSASPAQSAQASGTAGQPTWWKKNGGWFALVVVAIICLPMVLLAQVLTDEEVANLRKQELKFQQLEAASKGLTAASDLKMFESSMMSDAQAIMALDKEYDAVAPSNFTGKADVSGKAADAIIALRGNAREINLFISQNDKSFREVGANATRLSTLVKAIDGGLPAVALNITGELTAMAKGDPQKLAYIAPTLQKLRGISSGAT